jgi:hypothetical protein
MLEEVPLSDSTPDQSGEVEIVFVCGGGGREGPVSVPEVEA